MEQVFCLQQNLYPRVGGEEESVIGTLGDLSDWNLSTLRQSQQNRSTPRQSGMNAVNLSETHANLGWV
jgi:hypothetical protein